MMVKYFDSIFLIAEMGLLKLNSIICSTTYNISVLSNYLENW